ncbi:MAG TPA: basic secretory protein-like protein [Chthoniobacteraceae bacterium]|jgi:hypothetical protein|nr:basic secretory protein-like protein [Chthoniobacteraceae bacterium]
MKRLPALLFSLLLLCASARAAEPARITVDFSAAPECEAFAVKAQGIAEEWYPKINSILFGPEHPLPLPAVHLVFEPMKGVAFASGDKIHISAEWVTKKAPTDYGMVVHELTHIVQAYRRGNKVDGWVTEGIADYIRHQHFEKDPEVITKRINPDKASYTNSYTTAAAFLIWIETKKSRDFVAKLNLACHEGRYKVELFKELAGQDVDELWKEFTDSLRK